MINVINATGNHEFNALLYPDQNPFHTDYFMTQVNTFNDKLNEFGQQFISGAKAIYDRIHDSQALELARRAIRSAKGLYHTNLILPLLELEHIQAAQPIMQRWNMANPELRALFHQQRCNGYSDTYYDVQPGTIGETHDDYRKVMSGIVVEDDNDFHIDTFIDDIHEGDRELTSSEQFDILRTWEMIRNFIANGNDPSDPMGGKL